MTKIINLYGGPGIGKSTLSAGLFYEMKMRGYNVELVREWIKSAVYENRLYPFNDQLYTLAKQNKMLFELNGKVDYIITDSPILLNIIYQNPPTDYFREYALKVYGTYENIDILLLRNPLIDYKREGRNQEYSEAVRLDEMIKEVLDLKAQPYYHFMPSEEPARHLMDFILRNKLIG